MNGVDLRTLGTRLWRAGVGIYFLASVLALNGCRTAHMSEVSANYREKAAFLYDFSQFVQWPTPAFSSPAAPLVVGVFGDNPFGDELVREVRGQNINGHPLVVHQMSSPADLQNCHILFLNPSEKSGCPRFSARCEVVPCSRSVKRTISSRPAA